MDFRYKHYRPPEGLIDVQSSANSPDIIEHSPPQFLLPLTLDIMLLNMSGYV